MRRTTLAMAMAFAICAVAAGPALGDHGHHRGRGGYVRHGGYERQYGGWYGPRHFFYSSEPDVYYAPPPVIYTPAYPAPPSINFLFPLWIR